jgi:hypothetical protein
MNVGAQNLDPHDIGYVSVDTVMHVNVRSLPVYGAFQFNRSDESWYGPT